MSTVVFVFLCLRINWCYSGLKTSLYTLTVQLQKCIMYTLFLVILPVWSVRQAALVTLLLICLSAPCAASFLICLSDLSTRRSHSLCSWSFCLPLTLLAFFLTLAVVRLIHFVSWSVCLLYWLTLFPDLSVCYTGLLCFRSVCLLLVWFTFVPALSVCCWFDSPLILICLSVDLTLFLICLIVTPIFLSLICLSVGLIHYCYWSVC